MRVLSFVVVALLGLSCFEAREAPLTVDDFRWSREDLTSAFILDDQRAFLVSSSGSIYRSEDAGETWRRVYSETSEPLHDIAFSGAEQGWAVGDGRIISTTDAGRSWSSQPLPSSRPNASLRAVAALDRHHVVSVGLVGARFRSTDGGRTWEDRSDRFVSGPRELDGHEVEDARRRADPTADLGTLSCRGAYPDRGMTADEEGGPTAIDCVAGGEAGGFSITRDGGASWQAVPLAAPFSVDSLTLEPGEVELPPPARSKLTAFAREVAARGAVGVRLNAMVSSDEIERIGRQRDAEALFDVVEARLLDARTALEESGVDAAGIESLGDPPWGYADHLDDDPDFLERYWQSRWADQPGVAVESVELASVLSLNLEDGIGVGTRGLIFERLPGKEIWKTEPVVPDAEDLIALARDRDEWWVVSQTGRLFRSGRAPWVWRETELVMAENASASALESGAGIRKLVFSPGGSWGLMLGDSGRLLRRKRDLEHWEAVKDSPPAD